MITFEEAFRIVTESSFRSGEEVVSLAEAAGRALTLPVRSDMDMPPWNKSAVDGYACRHDDLGDELTVLETIAAGVMPQKEVVPGTCSRSRMSRIFGVQVASGPSSKVSAIFFGTAPARWTT